MQINLLDDNAAKFAQYVAKLPGRRSGGLYGVAERAGSVAAPAGAWNRLRLRAVGQQVTVWIDGNQVLSVDLQDSARQHADYPGLKQTSGYIGLEDHGEGIEFRSVRVRRL
jgi:hypothetical protein